MTPHSIHAARVEQTIDYWRVRLLPEWSVAVDWDVQPSGEASAECHRAPHYQRAVITLAHGWERGWPEKKWPTDWPPALEVEAVLVHELMHAVMHDLEASVRRVEGKAARKRFDHELERVIERQARTLVAERHGLDARGGSRP